MEVTIRMHVHRGCLILDVGEMGSMSLEPNQVEQLIQFWQNRPPEDTVVTVREILEEPPMN